jgi:hypothetical protein
MPSQNEPEAKIDDGLGELDFLMEDVPDNLKPSNMINEVIE